MKTAIIGGGAIGLLFGAYMSKAGFNPTIYVRRPEQKDVLDQHGLTLETNGEKTVHFVNSKLFTEGLSEADELVIVTVKQYDLPPILEILFLSPGKKTFLFLQNGMGHLPYLEGRDDRIHIGVIEHGSLKVSDNHVRHTGHGRIRISGFRHGAQLDQDLLSRLSGVGFPIIQEKDWYPILAEKLIVNSVINPLTALYQIENGQLLDNPELKNAMETLFDEAFSVLCLEDREGVWRNVLTVCEKTAHNQSSMLKDMKGNRRTEIDAISGYLLKEAENMGMELPVTSFVYSSVKGIQRLRGVMYD